MIISDGHVHSASDQEARNLQFSRYDTLYEYRGDTLFPERRDGTVFLPYCDSRTQTGKESRLVKVPESSGRPSRDPMHGLGSRLLSDPSFRPSVREAIRRVCGLHDDDDATSSVPASSVRRLAGQVNLAASTLRQYWREDPPLRCRLKEFMNWAVLLWAVRARAGADWDAIADQVGLRRRTLEINVARMAGCTLAAAARDPERVVERFDEWVDSVWEPRSVNGSGPHDPVSAPARDARAT